MKRRVGLFLVFGAAIPLVVASTAWACGVLATLSVDTRVASAGDAIVVTGKNFSSSPGASPVTIRLGNRKGTVVKAAAADPSNRISENVRVPEGTSPGWYVVTATQFNADGTPKSGTPARTTLRIQGSRSSARADNGAAVAASPWGSSTPTGPVASSLVADGAGSSQPLVPMFLAAVLSLTLLVAGSTLLGRRNQGPNRPPLGV